MAKTSSGTFFLRKMRHEHPPELQYFLGEVHLNPLLGQEIRLSFTGNIECIHCGRKIKKTFQQGYCYPCFQTLARCDLCILKPELCHYRHGTCREPDWAKENCLRDHIVYAAYSTNLKVGITRQHKMLERWGDQGALEAVPLARVEERYVAGLLEVELKKEVSDKTNWRDLIRGKFVSVDIEQERRRLVECVPDEYRSYVLPEAAVQEFVYPVVKYPERVKVHNFDKEETLVGILQGVHGQYLFVGERAVNIRKYGGYEISFAKEGKA